MEIGLDGRLFVEDPSAPHSIQLKQWLKQLTSRTTALRVSVFAPQGRYEAGEVFEISFPGSSVSAWKRLRFEHWDLPRQAKKAGMDLLLYAHTTAPAISAIPFVCFGGIPPYSSPYRFPERIGVGLSAAARTKAMAVLWPNDRLGEFRVVNQIGYWPFVDPTFKPKSSPLDEQVRNMYSLPEDYVLVHGSTNLEAVLAGWTWVVSGTGDYYSLVIVATGRGIDPSFRPQADEFGVSETIQVLSGIDHEHVAALYRQASVMISVGEDHSGNTLRWALTSGVPIAGFRMMADERILGGAGYLVEPGDTRALGGAVLSLLVQNELADELRAKGVERAMSYKTEEAMNSLEHILLQFAGQ